MLEFLDKCRKFLVIWKFSNTCLKLPGKGGGVLFVRKYLGLKNLLSGKKILYLSLAHKILSLATTKYSLGPKKPSLVPI